MSKIERSSLPQLFSLCSPLYPLLSWSDMLDQSHFWLSPSASLPSPIPPSVCQIKEQAPLPDPLVLLSLELHVCLERRLCLEITLFAFMLPLCLAPTLPHWPSAPRVRPERGLGDLQLCLLSTQTSVRTAGRTREGHTVENMDARRLADTNTLKHPHAMRNLHARAHDRKAYANKKLCRRKYDTHTL